jgi:amphiphysin
VQIQFTLLQNSYSSFYHYGNEHGFSDSDNDVIVSEWEDQFLALQDDIESNVSIIAGGKAVKMPMTLVQDNSIIAKVPGMMSLGRHTRAPSVTSQTLATDSARTHRDSAETSRPEIGKQRSSTSISTKYSRSETSPPTTSSSQRRSIGNARMRTPSIASGIDREESPPPPLPQPISSNSRRRNESNHLSGEQGRGGRQGSGIGSGTIPTPLAGLTPSNLASRTGTNIQSGQASVQMPLRISSSSLVRLSSSTQKSYSKTLDQGDLSTIVKTKKKPPPPPPKKKFGAPKEVWVRAIYPFQGQSEGDLSFDEGDRIKVLKKTDSTVGKLSLFWSQ